MEFQTKDWKRRIVKSWLAQFKSHDYPQDEEHENDEGDGDGQQQTTTKSEECEGNGEEEDASESKDDGNQHTSKVMTQDGEKMIVDIFPSVAAMISVGLERQKEGLDITVDRCTASRLGRYDINCLADAVRAVKGEWIEGLKILDELMSKIDQTHIAPPRAMRRRCRFRDSDGDEIDNDRLRNGQDYWRSSVRENTQAAQSITIICKMGGPSNINHRDLFWAGASAICLTDILEQQGYSVKLVGCSMIRDLFKKVGDHSWHTCFLEVKDTGKPMDKDAIAKAFSGWFFRTIYFQSFMSSKPIGCKRVDKNNGLGYPTTFCEDTEVIVDYVGNTKPIIICDIWSFEAAVNVIKNTLKEMET